MGQGKPDIDAASARGSSVDGPPEDDSFDTEIDREPCTTESHQWASASYESFLATTINHRPWLEEDRGIDILTGECELCGSTLGWSRGAEPMDEASAGEEVDILATASPTKTPDRRDGRVSPNLKAPVHNRSRFQGASNNSHDAALPVLQVARLTQTERVKANMSSSTLSRFLIEEGVISRNQLATALSLKMWQGDSATNEMLTSSIAANSSAPLQDDENRLAEALVRTGALTAHQLEPLLAAYSRGADGASEFVSALLRERPQSRVLQVITNQLIRSLMNTIGVRVAADGCHSQIDDVVSCEYTIYQSFTGDFQGEVYLNLSSSLMLEIASTLIATKATRVSALVADGACEFFNIVNGNSCVQLSAMGTKVELQRPLFFRHPQWGERVGAPFDLSNRVGGAAFTAVQLAHPAGRQELCFMDRT